MATRRASEPRGPFLGTEEIIERLREARSTLRRRQLRKLGAAAVGLLAVATAAGVKGYLRAGQPTRAEADAAIVARSVPQRGAPLAAPDGPDDVTGNSHAGATVYAHAASGHPPQTDAVAAPSGPTLDPSVHRQVHVDVRGGPGSIYVDGARVGMGESWDVRLGQGEHAIMVRMGDHTMRYRLNVAQQDVRLRFDRASNEIHEEPYTPPPSP